MASASDFSAVHGTHKALARFSDEDIAALGIPPAQVVQWVREAFLAKSESQLPHKISLTFEQGRKFYNTMPAIMPMNNCYGVKIVSRYPARVPSIQADLLLYDLATGELLAMVDATWITAKRTGAVATLAVETLARPGFQTVAVMGLGSAGKAFLETMASQPKHRDKHYKLLRYKNHAEQVAKYLADQGVRSVQICDDHETLIKGSDVVVSAVTVAEKLVSDPSWFRPGALLLPIHTRGFQNCDLVFDRVIADDRSHVEGFMNYKNFPKFAELDQVLKGEDPGRTDDTQRIIGYNIGIALHDVHIGRRLLDMFSKRGNEPVPNSHK